MYARSSENNKTTFATHETIYSAPYTSKRNIERPGKCGNAMFVQNQEN